MSESPGPGERLPVNGACGAPRRLARRLIQRSGAHGAPLIIFASLFALGCCFFFRMEWAGRPAARVAADGHYYYAYLVSAWFDHDLDLSNQYAGPVYCKNVYGFGRTETGLPANPFSVGPALLWAPFFGVADVVSRVGHHFDPAIAVDGVSPLYQHITLFGTFLYAFLALLLAYRVACRRARPYLACLASVGAFVGGTVLWYALGQPSYSHAQSAFLAALLVDIWDPKRRRADVPLSPWQSVLAGVALGLAADVRPEDVLFCLVFLVDAACRLRRDFRAPSLRREAATLAIIAAAAFVAFLPQMAAWKVIYGHWLTVPVGEGFMRWTEPRLLDPLFSTRNGLFPFAPIWWVAAFIGFPLWLWRRERAAAAALLVSLAIIYVNGAAYDWWGGGTAFGGRRYASLAIFVALALAALLDHLARAIEARPARAAAIMLSLAVGCFGVWTIGLMGTWNRGGVRDERGVDWAHFSGETTETLLRDVEDSVGDPWSWPANWLFALAHRTDPARYDLVIGTYLLTPFMPAGHPSAAVSARSTVDLATSDGERFLASGFGGRVSVPSAGGLPLHGVALTERRGCLVLPINRPGAVQAAIKVAALGAPGSVALRWEGHFLGSFQIDSIPRSVGGLVPADWVRRGPNDLCVETALPSATRPAIVSVELEER